MITALVFFAMGRGKIPDPGGVASLASAEDSLPFFEPEGKERLDLREARQELVFAPRPGVHDAVAVALHVLIVVGEPVPRMAEKADGGPGEALLEAANLLRTGSGEDAGVGESAHHEAGRHPVSPGAR